MNWLSWIKDHVSQGASYPSSRVGHTFTYIPESDFYLLYGGISNKRTNEIYLYNPRSCSWKHIDSNKGTGTNVQIQLSNLSEEVKIEVTGKIPLGTCYHWAWYDHPHFFIMGGETDKKKTNDIYCLNLETWIWRKFFVFEPPLPRYQHSMCKVERESSVYLFGGYTSKNTNDLWELDLSAVSFKGKGDIPGAVWNNLSQKGSIPPPRRGHKIIKIPGQNKLVLYGGYTLQNEEVDKQQDNNIYILDVFTTTWTKLKVEGILPEPRALHCQAFITPTEMIIMGGIESEKGGKDTEVPSVLSNTFLVDFENYKISQPSIAHDGPSKRYGHTWASNENPEDPEILIIGGIATTYCIMDPYRLQYQYSDSGLHYEETAEDKQKIEEMKETIKISNRNILENNKIIAELENEAIELSSHNAKKNRQINKIQAELDNLSTRKLEIERALEDKNRKLTILNDSHKSKANALSDMIKEKQKLTNIYKKKIETLEQNFSKAEMFLLKLIPVYEKLDMVSNSNSGGLLDPLRASNDNSTVEALKTQHRKSLIGVKDFYSKFDKKLETIQSKNNEKMSSLKEYSKAFGINI